MKALSLILLSVEGHKEKLLTFKKYRLYWLNNSCTYTRGICANYEVSVIKPVARSTVHRQ